MSSTQSAETENDHINYNAVFVAKEGGTGVKSASEMMGVRGVTPRSLGAPPPRQPRGGTFVTQGGVTIDATVRPLHYTHGDIDQCTDDDDTEDCELYVSSFFRGGEESGLTWGSDGAIERLVDLLDHRKGALLTSSYEFPGRYVRCFILQLYEYGLKYLIANLQTQHILILFLLPAHNKQQDMHVGH